MPSDSVYIIKSNQHPIEPTPNDPLANIDSALTTGGKDSFVSPAEVRGAGVRAALTPSPHRNTKHLGPNEWVHVSPEGGSIGRGSRVSGDDAPVPDKEVDNNYTLPDVQPNVHGGNYADIDDEEIKADDSEERNPYTLAKNGYDFSHPHQARQATEAYLRYLIESGHEKESYNMRTEMHSDDRLSLYPSEIADGPDGREWMNEHMKGFSAIPSPAAEIAKARVSTAIHIRGIKLPRKEYEPDPVEQRNRIKARKEREKKRRAMFPHHRHFPRLRKEEDMDSSYATDDEVDDENEEPEVEEEEYGLPDDGTTTDNPVENVKKEKRVIKSLDTAFIFKSGIKQAQKQDITPMHVYKQRDGRGYRNVNVVPVGVPHGAGARQEFPDPAWRLDQEGHISFSSRDHKRHSRHPHTILPVHEDEHGRQNLHMLHQMSKHAKATADRDGDTNGFWDRLPTAEEVPFYPNDRGGNDVEAYHAVRSIKDGAEDSARKNKIHSHSAESWRDYAQTIARAIESNTGQHPELHLLASDVQRIAALREQAEEMGKELEDNAQMHTFPMPGVTFFLRCDRTSLPAKANSELDKADAEMADNCEAIGRLFKNTRVVDKREEDSPKNQRRAWLQLSEDFHNAIKARHPDVIKESPASSTWSDSVKKGSASPFFLLSQSEATTNFNRIISEKKQLQLQKYLGMSFQKYAKEVLHSLDQDLPEELKNIKMMEYIDKIRPTLTMSLQQLPLIFSEGVITPQTTKDPSGISHASIVTEEIRGGLDNGIYLYDGEQYGSFDVTILFHPRIYNVLGVIGFNSSDFLASGLKNRAYRPSRTNRAMMHLVSEMEPIISAERWTDLTTGQFTMLRSQVTVIPLHISLGDIEVILLHPQTPEDIVISMRTLASRENRRMNIQTGTYRDWIAK